MNFERVYSIANKWTFKIKPIKKLLDQEMNGGIWIDPYAGMNSPATITNDINPKMPTQHHLEADEFVRRFIDSSVDGVLLDPPYSYGQFKECYQEVGSKPPLDIFNTRYEARVKKEISRIVKPNGKVISFGWNSDGIGKHRGFEMYRVLLVYYGGHKYDTIVTVERKINRSLFE